MKQIKRKLGKVALFYNIINILSLIISIICYLNIEKMNRGIIFLLPCIAILLSVIFTIAPLLEKNANLSLINFKTYQKTNLSISVIFCFIQIALLTLIFSVDFNVNILICIALGLLLMIIGNFLPKMKMGSFIEVLFPHIKGNYQAWRRFVRFSGFVLFVEGIFIIILGGLYKNWITYLIILLIDLLVIILIYLASLYYARNYHMESSSDEMED